MPHLTLKQIAYNTIKEKILTCEYEPNSFLNEDILCRELKMSRTPVRDALSRLEQEHLVTILPKKGFFISPLSIPEINMVFEGRYLIEPYIISNYCVHLPDDVKDRLLEIITQEKNSILHKDSGIYTRDYEFHSLLMSQCTNRYFINLYEDLHNQNSRLRVLSGRSSDERLSQTLSEHTAIYKELTLNNTDKAADHMRQHILNAKESAFHSLIHINSALTDK